MRLMRPQAGLAILGGSNKQSSGYQLESQLIAAADFLWSRQVALTRHVPTPAHPPVVGHIQPTLTA
jgi:hypothetical protein